MINNFKFWCQKVLPLVYDDSLSYYEVLCKVTDYLNQVINAVNKNTEDTQNLISLYNQLKEYVDNYFTNLDVQEEINNKLDEMVNSGELDQFMGIDNVLAAQKVLFFGDSTTAGFISDSGTPVLSPEDSYPSVFQQKTKANVINYAQGGATMSNKSGIPTQYYSFDLQIGKAIDDNNLQDCDFAFVNFGINDHGQNVVIGEPTIYNTQYYSQDRFIDSFILGVNRIWDINPKCKVIAILPHYTTRELMNLSTANNNIFLTLDAYRNALIRTCSELNLPVVDFRNCGINSNNAMTYHNGDPFHLTKLGYYNEGEYLAKNWMNADIGGKKEYPKHFITTYNLLPPSMFNYSDNNYATNYINGALINIQPNATITSNESLYVIQTGYYLLNFNVRAFESTSFEIKIYNDTTTYTNNSYAVSFSNVSIPIFIPSNILNANISIKNIGENQANLSNISLMPYGNLLSTMIRNQKITCQGAENITLAGNYIAKLENNKIHLNLHFTTTQQTTGTIITLKNVNFNAVIPLINTTDNNVTYINFTPSGSDTIGNVASVASGKELFLHATAYIGNNNTPFSVIS